MGKLFPEARPHKVPEFQVKQSKYPHVPVLPMRALIYGPSGSGKTVLLQNLILDIYRGCFARWYIFSPSINLDHTWVAVQEYIRNEMGVDTDKEKCFFDEYDPEALEATIKQQFKLADTMKITASLCTRSD
jgi:predicted AAA+ superfamily ATPase